MKSRDPRFSRTTPALGRRRFVSQALFGSLGLTLGGCGSAGTKAAAGASGGASNGGGDGGSCDATAADSEGPYFAPESPEKSVFVTDSTPGERLQLSGQVLDAACSPVAGAIVDFWQADVDGAYDNVGFELRGHIVTDAEGRYELSTIVPGRYLNGDQYRPAHIHAKVYVAGQERLTTQIYFDGDPFNDVDPWYNPDNAVSLAGSVDAGWSGRFDFAVAAG